MFHPGMVVSASVIPGLEGRGQEDHKFGACLGYLIRPYLAPFTQIPTNVLYNLTRPPPPHPLFPFKSHLSPLTLNIHNLLASANSAVDPTPGI